MLHISEMLPKILSVAACLVACSYALYSIFLKFYFSHYRHLPRANQPCVLKRLFHEPSTFELEAWARNVPNEGIIRYFGFLNQERLMVTTIEAYKELLLRDADKYDKLPGLSALQSPVGVSGLVSAKGALHKIHRRHTIAAYNASWTRTLCPEIFESCKATTTALHRTASMSPRGVFKVNQFLRAVCLDIVGKADFSLDLDAVAKPDQELIKRYLHAFDVGEQSPMFLKLLQICPVALQLSATTIVSKLIGIDISLMRGVIEASVATKLEALQRETSAAGKLVRDGQEDLLQRICSRSHTQLSQRALSRHALTALAGSVEMVSNELAWALYALSLQRHQRIQDKLRDEIMSHFPSSPDSLTWEDLRDMPYLTGVVNEALRLFPSVAHRFRVCNTRTKLLGRDIQKGTMIVWPTYAVNRRPDLWGNDAHVFRPKRWNEGNGIDGNVGKRDAYAFMTFGQGPRKCPGGHYTRVVMACVLLMFVGRFRFTMPPGHGDVLEGDDKKQVKFGIVMKAPIYVQVEEIPSWCHLRDTGGKPGTN